MSIDLVSAQQFLDQLRTALLDKTSALDTGFGPILDAVLRPLSVALEDQNNNRLRKVSLLQSLTNAASIDDDDLDARVFDEAIIRPDGSFGSTTVTFSVAARPAVDTTVQKGFGIATLPDESTGRATTFVVTEAKTLYAATASSYFNAVTNRYELVVPVTCTEAGVIGKVGPNRITRPLRPLVGFDAVTNPAAVISGGRDPFTNAELLVLYFLSVVGRQLATPQGIEFFTRDTFTSVEDAHEVFGTNPLLTRGGTEAGAVDMYIKGAEPITVTDNGLTYPGPGQTIRVLSPPLIGPSSVAAVTIDGNTAVEGTDFVTVIDDTGVSGSTRAVDGISVLASSSLASSDIGSAVTITYTYNDLIRRLQARDADDDVSVEGRQILYREAAEVPIVLVARLKTRTGFNPTSTAVTVTKSLLAFGKTLGIGDDVEASDLQGEVRKVSGVDNFVITRLTRVSTLVGIDDIAVEDNEWPSFSQANILLVPV